MVRRGRRAPTLPALFPTIHILSLPLSLSPQVRTQYVEGSGERGGGDQTAAERVADLLEGNATQGAWKEKEAKALKARMQWQPTKDQYKESMSHAHGIGHGPTIGPAAGGFGYVTTQDLHRVPGHSNEVAPENKVELAGPASQTKDWRTESSRIGRYFGRDDFKLKPYGTWTFEDAGPAHSGVKADLFE